MVGNPGKRLFHTALYGTTGPLALPAVKIRTVILDTQCDAHIFSGIPERSAHPYTPVSPQRRTTAGMQEVEQCMEQLPKGRREILFFNENNN
jgi:hypothetical protein